MRDSESDRVHLSAARRGALLFGGVALLALVLVTFLVIRSSSEDGYKDVRALIGALEAGGMQCRQPNLSPPDPAPELVDFGSCQIDGKTVNLSVYKDGDALDRHIESNISVRGDDPNYFTSLVHGSNWIVDTYSEETSRDIQGILGGEIR